MLLIKWRILSPSLRGQGGGTPHDYKTQINFPNF
jgi:hypothetical protein